MSHSASRLFACSSRYASSSSRKASHSSGVMRSPSSNGSRCQARHGQNKLYMWGSRTYQMQTPDGGTPGTRGSSRSTSRDHLREYSELIDVNVAVASGGFHLVDSAQHIVEPHALQCHLVDEHYLYSVACAIHSRHLRHARLLFGDVAVH